MVPNITPNRSIAEYLVAIAASLFGLWALWNLWSADLNFPLTPMVGDAIHAQATIFKGMTDNSWYLDNQWLGAPFGLNMRDFPLADILLLGSAKFLALFTKNHHLIRNLVAIGSYPLVTISSLYVMRKLRIRYLVALAASLLFAFQTFHHMRIGPHVLFGFGYFSVPFATLLAIELFDNREHILMASTKRFGIRWRGGPETWRTLALCMVLGMTGTVYFPYFSCYVLFIAGVFSALHNRSILPWLRSLLMQGVIGVAMFAVLLPTVLQNMEQGQTQALARNPQDAELYALKIVQMIIPGSGHRVDAWQRIGEYYNRLAPVVTENRTAYLGLIGVVGFFYLVVSILHGEWRDSRLRTLSILNIAVVLLGTLGGLSSLIAFLVSYKIRSYNRIGVYVAFFALLALALLVERLFQWWATSRTRRTGLVLAVALTTVLGLYDQCALEIDYAALKTDWIAEDKFAASIEARLPKHSSIFELPYFPFPENGPVAQLPEYSPMIPYLHSKALRWSYGSQKGRRGDAWIARVSQKPPEETIENVAQAGFKGILVFRQGYRDQGAKIEEVLTAKLGPPAVVSRTGDRAFYSLLDYLKMLRDRQGEAEFQRRQDEVLHPMYLGLRDGFYPTERDGTSEHSWCMSKGQLVIENPSSRSKHVVLNVDLRVAQPPAVIRFQSDVYTRRVIIKQGLFRLSDRFDVPPGTHLISVNTDSDGRTDERLRDLRMSFSDPIITTLGQ